MLLPPLPGADSLAFRLPLAHLLAQAGAVMAGVVLLEWPMEAPPRLGKSCKEFQRGTEWRRRRGKARRAVLHLHQRCMQQQCMLAEGKAGQGRVRAAGLQVRLNLNPFDAATRQSTA